MTCGRELSFYYMVKMALYTKSTLTRRAESPVDNLMISCRAESTKRVWEGGWTVGEGALRGFKRHHSATEKEEEEEGSKPAACTSCLSSCCTPVTLSLLFLLYSVQMWMK